MKRGKKGPKISVVLGTRPEIIKLSSILRELQAQKADFDVIHTGQHYSYEMDRVFFKELRLPVPNHSLAIRSSGLHGEHVARMIIEIEKIFLKTKPDVVLVQGDTNSVLAGALAASKIPHILIGHVEAGLRSYDRSMPEEINRMATDAVSHLLFAPTPISAQILLKSGFKRSDVFVTGNTVVDAVLECVPFAKKIKVTEIPRSNRYALITLHRQENVDNPERLRMILRGLEMVSEKLDLPILFPAHPRTLARLKDFGFKLPACITTMEPAGFLKFLKLQSEATLILSDSGGVQEEACILKVPCVTLRTSTERPETVHVGANILAGDSSEQILAAARKMLGKPRNWKNPFGDGKAGKRILSAVRKRVS